MFRSIWQRLFAACPPVRRPSGVRRSPAKPGVRPQIEVLEERCVPSATLATPTLLTPNTGVPTAMPTFSWQPVSAATHYDVWVDDATTGRRQAVRNPNVAGTSWQTSSVLTPGDGYNWYVRALDDVGDVGSWSAAASFSVTPLAAPTQVGPSGGVQNTLPAFTWTPGAGADSYDVWVDDVTTHTSQVLRNPGVTDVSWTPTTPLTPGDVYKWYVRGVSNNGDSSAWTAPMQFTVLFLDKPTPLTPSGNINSLLPTLTWTTVTGANLYDVWISDLSALQFPAQHNSKATGGSWTLTTPLAPDHVYAWYVRALSSTGNVSPWTTFPVFFTTKSLDVPTPLTPDENIIDEQASDLTPVFNWTASAGADGYEVYVSDNGSMVYDVPVAGGAVTWTPPAALTVGDHYTWWVRAEASTDGNTSDWSGPAHFTIELDAPQPTAPNDTQNTRPTLQWNPVNDADSYNVWLRDNVTGEVVTGMVHTTTGVPESDLTPRHNYTLWVQAQISGGVTSAWGGPQNFRVNPLDTPAGLAPTGHIGDLSPPFTWNPVNLADTYEVFVQDNGHTIYDVTVQNTTTWTPPAPLTFGDTFTWWVKASNAANNSDWQATPATFVLDQLPAPVPIAPMGNINFPSSNGNVFLKWNPVTGANSYEVLLSDSSGNILKAPGATVPGWIVGAETNFDPVAVAGWKWDASRTYTWQVRALFIDPAVLGSFSDQASLAAGIQNRSTFCPVQTFTFNPLQQVVTTTDLAANPNPMRFHGNTSLVAVVNDAKGQPVAAGTVKYIEGGVLLDTEVVGSAKDESGALEPGVAVFLTFDLTLGMHHIEADYSGGTSPDGLTQYLPSTNTVDVTVQPANSIVTTTTVQADPTTAAVGDTVTFTATIVPDSGAVAVGTVNFMENGVLLGSAPLDGNGLAAYSTPFAKGGKHTIEADYMGGTSADGTTQWQPSSGTVDVAVQITAPVPLASLESIPFPTGNDLVLQWTPVTGANAYEVLLTDSSGATLTAPGAAAAGWIVAGTTFNPAVEAGWKWDLTKTYTWQVQSLFLDPAVVGTKSDQASLAAAVQYRSAFSAVQTFQFNPLQAVDTRTNVYWNWDILQQHREPGAGDQVTFTAAVDVNDVAVTAGTVNFILDGVMLGSAPLDSDGNATFLTTIPTTSKHILEADYKGATSADNTMQWLPSGGTFAWRS